MALITTIEAAQRLGISERRVRQLITDEKKIKAQLIGGVWVIDDAELKNVKVYGKAGRPKSKAA